MIGEPIINIKRIWSERAWSLSIQDCADYDAPRFHIEAENCGYEGRTLDEIEGKVRSDLERASAALRALSAHREEMRAACEANPLGEARERVEAVRKRFGIDFTSAAALLGEALERGETTEAAWARWEEGYRKLKELEEALRRGRIKHDEHAERTRELWRRYGTWISYLRFEAERGGGDDTGVQGRGGANG